MASPSRRARDRDRPPMIASPLSLVVIGLVGWGLAGLIFIVDAPLVVGAIFGIVSVGVALRQGWA